MPTKKERLLGIDSKELKRKPLNKQDDLVNTKFRSISINYPGFVQSHESFDFTCYVLLRLGICLDFNTP